MLGRDATLLDAFKAANDVLLGAVQGIADLITRPGLINVDFADVRTVMSEMGMAMMGTGTASGENRARAAAEAAITNPLLEDVNLSGAHGILVNVTAGLDLRTSEFDDVGDTVKQFASRRRDRRRRLRARSGHDRHDPRHRRRDRHRPAGSRTRHAAGGAAPKVEVVAGASRARGRIDNYADFDTPAYRRQRPRAVGEDVRASANDESLPGHPGVPAPPGRLTDCRKPVATGRCPFPN